MRFLLYLVLVLQLAIISINGVQAVEASNSRGAAETATCQAFHQLNVEFAKLTRQGEREAASLSYYRQHPAELQRVTQDDEKNLAALERGDTPNYC